MRMKPKSTPTEAVRVMSPEQRQALARAVSAREVESSTAQGTKTKIREALQAGVPAVVLAHELNLSRGRIYQIRDEAAT